jgi:uncharacterized membrane protein YphA (DoxX/SURF4 family)
MVRMCWLTCFFLVLLRLAIGWHFFFEGFHKLRSKETDKPFSSQGYFNEAEGPLGPKIREFIGDPDLLMKAKLQLNDGTTPAEQMPKLVAGQWDAYFDRFSSFYKLNDQQKERAKAKLDEAKADFIHWRTFTPSDNQDEKTRAKWTIIKKDSPFIGTAEVPQNIPLEVQRYENTLKEIRDIYTAKLARDVSFAKLRELKAEAAKMRNSFQKDIDELTAKMKDSLAKVLDPRSVGFDVGVPASDSKYDDRLLACLTLDAGSKMPEALGGQWDDYAAYVKEYGNPQLRKGDTQEEAALDEAKQEYVRYLEGKNEFSGEPSDSDVPLRLKAYQAAVVKYKAATADYAAKKSPDNEKKLNSARAAVTDLRKGFVDDIKRFTEILKRNLGGFSEDNLKGLVEVEKPTNRFLWINWPTSNLEWLDTVTPWTLLIAGGCLLVGLFTRLACIVAAGFLLVEYLSQAAFPWLPKSPMTEGNYLFVNKNVIEFIALLALATTSSGKWLGLDALVGRLCPFCRRKKPPEPTETKKPQKGTFDKDQVSLFDAPPTRSAY